jgi:N-formylglutamate deformylase
MTPGWRLQRCFDLFEPSDCTSCAVFSSPHSGSFYPEEFLASARLTQHEIRSSEDAFVDMLFAAAPRHGAPLIAARYPRAFVDLNRAEEELDPALIAGAARTASNPRVAAGLGVIPRVVAEGVPIRDGKISLREALERLRLGYRPFHDTLGALIRRQKRRFGIAVLYDCHSMPHDALSSAPLVRGRRPDIILGDRFGSSCARWIMDAASDTLTAAGFTVARNAPFAGGYITQHYGRPSLNMHAIQIEVDRSLYMDEERIERTADFADVVARLDGAVHRLAALGAGPAALAAE